MKITLIPSKIEKEDLNEEKFDYSSWDIKDESNFETDEEEKNKLELKTEKIELTSERYSCIICNNKTFQFKNKNRHEKSIKHVLNIEKIKNKNKNIIIEE